MTICVYAHMLMRWFLPSFRLSRPLPPRSPAPPIPHTVIRNSGFGNRGAVDPLPSWIPSRALTAMVRWGSGGCEERNHEYMDTTEAVTHVGLCAGYGGIELGLGRVVRNLRTVALCEIEAFAIANLVAKMEAGLMDPAPIWPDLRTFPWGAFRDRVDILTGGYPCQPFSAAGKRLGGEDPRHLWPFISSGIRILRPRVCFFENVEGHISMGLSSVISDLEEMGYRATWGIFSAAEVGAAHQRKRVFVVAVSADALRERGQFPFEWIEPAIEDAGGDGTAWRAEDGGDWECKLCGSPIFGGCECEHGESRCHRCGEWTYPFHYESGDGCSHCGSEWPRWDDPESWPVEPVVCGGDDGVADRVDRLRLLGNGVVPATAALAFRTLINRFL